MNDLQKRLIVFAGDIIRLAKEFGNDPLLSDCLRQMIRSGSSAGANYSEAQSANSMKDFHHKIRIALEEMKETDYWIGLLMHMYPDNLKINGLYIECAELMKILGTISKKTDPDFRKRSGKSGPI
jgi:four helix bundle protein